MDHVAGAIVHSWRCTRRPRGSVRGRLKPATATRRSPWSGDAQHSAERPRGQPVRHAQLPDQRDQVRRRLMPRTAGPRRPVRATRRRHPAGNRWTHLPTVRRHGWVAPPFFSESSGGTPYLTKTPRRSARQDSPAEKVLKGCLSGPTKDQFDLLLAMSKNKRPQIP